MTFACSARRVHRRCRPVPLIAVALLPVLHVALPLGGAERPRPPAVAVASLGQMPDGTNVDQYTLTNSQGVEVKLMTYGATLTSVKTPDRDGHLANITLNLDTLDDYLAGHPLFGSVVGRFANRIGGAAFMIDGVRHPLTANAGRNHIHGGREGFHKKIWSARAMTRPDAAIVELSLVSPDGDEGYPGELRAVVRYELTDADELKLDCTATTDKPTVVNLTNHAYWNLAGAGSGDVLDHQLTLYARSYLATDDQKVPNGEIVDVRGTPLDFTRPHTIGSRIQQVADQNYDHCYVLDKPPGAALANAALAHAAHVFDPHSGRTMDVWTTKPGVQLFTAKMLNARWRTGDRPYGPYYGFCLETQHFPDAPNHANFPSAVLRPSETYHHTTIFKFSARR